jgi:hypothetical protein
MRTKTISLFIFLVVFTLNIIPILTGLVFIIFDLNFIDGYSLGFIITGLYLLKFADK